MPQSRAPNAQREGHHGTNWWDKKKRDLIEKDPTYVVKTSLPKYEPEYPDGAPRPTPSAIVSDPNGVAM